jgi:hypothetical protein
MQGRQGNSVQLYQDDTFLKESVTSFLTEGLQVNDTVIVVATAQHSEERLEALTPGKRALDNLMFIDAGEQLQKFMVDDWPSVFRFKKVVGRHDWSGSLEDTED